MRLLLISLTLVAASVAGAHAQSVMLPANADLRAMQAPANWEGSRSQQTQDADPDSARWTALALPDVMPHFGGTAPAATATVPVVAQGTPDYRVDVWDRQDHLVETLAHCATLAVGRAAFKEAAKERPGQKVTLRRDAIVVAAREATSR